MTQPDQNGSFRRFEEAVIAGAEKRAAAIVLDAEKTRQNELRAASKGTGAADLERQRQLLLTARRQAEAKRRQDAWRELLQTRAALAQSLFDEVRARVLAFTATPAYDDFLAARAASHADLAGKAGLRVLLRPGDEARQALLQKTFPQAQFGADRGIELGGFLLVCGSLVYDETLDTAFAAEQERFTSESGLRV